MKIASSDITLQSSHMAYSRFQSSERLEMWSGERNDRGAGRAAGRDNGLGALVRDAARSNVSISKEALAAQEAETTAIEGARLLEPLRPRWLEEPVQWADDRRELKLLSKRTRIPLSAGESELTSWGCRALVDEQAIDILQFDCTMTGGFTEGRKLAALCELNHVQVAPHHDCFIHAHIVAASPAGCIVESFTDPERDPLQAELFENPPDISNGWLTLNQDPGLGLRLSDKAIKKFGEKIL